MATHLVLRGRQVAHRSLVVLFLEFIVVNHLKRMPPTACSKSDPKGLFLFYYMYIDGQLIICLSSTTISVYLDRGIHFRRNRLQAEKRRERICRTVGR